MEKKIHPLWHNFERINELIQIHGTIENEIMLKPIVNKYQYIYTSPKGRISLIELTFTLSDYKWEMCGGGIQCPERFRTKEDAEAKIKELLE